MNEIDYVIQSLEALKADSQRLGSYELAIIEESLKILKSNQPSFSVQDMQKAFQAGSRILYDNHSLDYLATYRNFMNKNYQINLSES